LIVGEAPAHYTAVVFFLLFEINGAWILAFQPLCSEIYPLFRVRTQFPGDQGIGNAFRPQRGFDLQWTLIALDAETNESLCIALIRNQVFCDQRFY
jgi:hypothetical protein